MSALYNENDAYAARWLENLVGAGHIAPGAVESRSIKELTAADVTGPGQRHFFAGIGVWSYALRLAGWSDSASVWTGSCPCQPWSGAGKGEGFDDPRHLWPDWFDLIEAAKPAGILGEQVASPDGLAWLDSVFADLEGAGYACWAVDICAAGIGAPHIRQRLYWCAVDLERIDELLGVADSAGVGFDGRRSGETRDGQDASRLESERLRDARGVGNSDGLDAGRNSGAGVGSQGGARLRAVGDESRSSSAARWMGEPIRARLEELAGHGDHGHEPRRVDAVEVGSAPEAGPVNGFWSDAEWLPCRDGKWRPVRPGSFPLAHGAPARVGRLRAYGNAIVAQEAAAFAQVVREFLEQHHD